MNKPTNSSGDGPLGGGSWVTKLGRRGGQDWENLFCGETVQSDEFVARRVTANQFDTALAAMQPVCKQFDQRFVGSGVDGRSRYLDAQFFTERFANLVFRCARLNFDGQQDFFTFNSQVRRM